MHTQKRMEKTKKSTKPMVDFEPNDLILTSATSLVFQGKQYLCATGKGGIKEDKKEGDSATPTGIFPIRYGLYRADRHKKPQTTIHFKPIKENEGWCDDSADSNYNRLVSLPYPGRHEHLWRQDYVYDFLIVIGHNDSPVIPGNGSAVFIHLARENYSKTEGCVALGLDDFLEILQKLDSCSRLVVPKLKASKSLFLSLGTTFASLLTNNFFTKVGLNVSWNTNARFNQ